MDESKISEFTSRRAQLRRKSHFEEQLNGFKELTRFLRRQVIDEATEQAFCETFGREMRPGDYLNLGLLDEEPIEDLKRLVEQGRDTHDPKVAEASSRAALRFVQNFPAGRQAVEGARADAAPASTSKPEAQPQKSVGEMVTPPTDLDMLNRSAHKAWRAASGSEGAPSQMTNSQGLRRGKTRGRRSNPQRRAAIQKAILAHGEAWRDHLCEIFEELDRQEVPLGDFQSLVIELGDCQTQRVSKWSDLDLADGDQRRKVLDALRKYLDQRI